MALSGNILARLHLVLAGLAILILIPDSGSAADLRLRMIGGGKLEGRVYDLGSEYLELGRRLGSTIVLKRDVVSWRILEKQKPEPKGILLILDTGHEVGGNVRFDPDTREWVVDLELGSARYPDSDVSRTIQPNGVCSDDRFTLRIGFEGRIHRAINGVIDGAPFEREEGAQFLRSAGFFSLKYLEEALDKSHHPILRRLQLEEQLRTALPEGITESRPAFLKQITQGTATEQVEVLREALLEHGSELYPLLGLLLLDDAQSVRVRTFSVDVLQRTHSIRELVTAWERSEGQAQLVLAIALGENGIHLGISTLVDALALEEVAVRTIAAKKLLEYTGELFGFEADGDPDSRAESIRQWRAWWEQNRSRVESIAISVLDGKDLSMERRKASDLWRQGIEAEADQRYEVAKRIYREAIEIDPTAMGPFVSLGILQYQHEADYDGALDSFRRAIGREPGLGDGANEKICYFHMGRIFQFGLDFDRARGALLKAVRLDRNYSAAWYELGKIQYEEALLARGGIEERRERLAVARDTFRSGIEALTRYRDGLVVVDRTNLPFDSALPFSTRDHNRTLRELRVRILEELGRFRGRIAAISLVLGDPKRVIREHRDARSEGSLSVELEKLVVTARKILKSQSEPPVEPVPAGGSTGEDDGEH